LVSDIGLPDGSGDDLIRRLRENGHNLPAIALSGFGMQQDIERSRAAGFQVYLIKPVSPQQLPTTIDQLLNKQRSQTSVYPVVALCCGAVGVFLAGLFHAWHGALGK
jgi:CheY-like chemotaxis protein